MSRIAQPSFVSYFDLDTRPNATALLSATNGIFQTGGVLGTLTLLVFSIPAENVPEPRAEIIVDPYGATDLEGKVDWQW